MQEQHFFQPAYFNTIKKNELLKKELFYLDGNGFLSLSIALIEFLVNNQYHRPDLFPALLKRHFQLFDKHHYVMENHPTKQPALKEKWLTTKERLAILSKNARFIYHMAVTLYQLSIDIILNNPEHYARVFFRGDQYISPAMLRRETNLHQINRMVEDSVSALANTLQLPIHISVVNEDHDLPRVHAYGPKANLSNRIDIQFNTKRADYETKLFDPSYVNILIEGRLSQCHEPSPIPLLLMNDPAPEDIITRVQKAQKTIANIYETHITEITKQLEPMSKEQLLALYIEEINLENHDKPQNIAYFPKDNQKQFAKVENDPMSQNNQLIIELAKILAKKRIMQNQHELIEKPSVVMHP